MKILLFTLLLLPIWTSASVAQLVEFAFPQLTFANPVDLQEARDGTNRLFVIEQAGIIYVFENSPSTTTRSVFLDIRDRLVIGTIPGSELGLLGLTFHPDYKTNGHFYINYTAPNPLRTVIARYSMSATSLNQADRNSQLILLEYNQPFTNHNGGQVSFGPDGYLYIASGDGGSGGDPQDNARNLTNLLGKILRIDVNNPSGGRNYGIPPDNPYAGNTSGAREEIYAYGLRNPWRFSFDPPTGRLWAGDVGQSAREEIDIIEKGKNYGWRVMEGTLCYNPPSGCNSAGLALPIWEYGRSEGVSVTGGFVYRGSRNPELVGAYVYGDYASGRLWSLRYDGTNPPQNSLLTQVSFQISSFGIDKNNELYICGYNTGKIYRLRSTATTIERSEISLPTSFHLGQNFPNPFNPSTTIRYSVQEPSFVLLSIVSIDGRLIRHLVQHHHAPGTYSIQWDGADERNNSLPSGVYLYRLSTDLFLETKKLLLIR